MLRLEVVPLNNVGKIKFGMKKEKIRDILGEAIEFKKNLMSETLTDDYGYCHVYYNKNNECEAVEIFDSVEVFVNDKQIFPISIEQAKNIIPDFEQDEDGLINYNLSIGIYAPDDKMESIIFGEKGYYEL